MKNFSIIIPVYNEEKFLNIQIKRIISGLKSLNLLVKYEIILVENGSTDKTGLIAALLARKFRTVKYYSLSVPSYGQSFKEGLKKALHPYIFQFDIDFWDLKFIVKSQKLLQSNDFVIGSKNLNNSIDKRPLLRKLISKCLEKTIDARFNISISDTHGLKALRKTLVEKYINDIKCPNHFFDSELLIRAIKNGSTFCELPVNLEELRASRFSFSVRIREVFKEFMVLMSVRITDKNVQPGFMTSKLPKSIVNYITHLFV